MGIPHHTAQWFMVGNEQFPAASRHTGLDDPQHPEQQILRLALDSDLAVGKQV
jgi:hypothetical protein